MGSGSSIPDQIDVLSLYKETDSYLRLYLSSKSSKVIQQNFYLIPKSYLESLEQTFKYEENLDELEQLNIYKNPEEQSSLKENEYIFKMILEQLKKNCEQILDNKTKLKKIENITIIGPDDYREGRIKYQYGIIKNYKLKTDPEGKFSLVLANLWEKLNDLYKSDIELKRIGYIVNGEIIVVTEWVRVDSFFVFNGRKKHFAFIMESNESLFSFVNSLKKNGTQNFLKEIGFKYANIPNPIFNQIIKIKYDKINSGALIYIVYLDDEEYAIDYTPKEDNKISEDSGKERDNQQIPLVNPDDRIKTQARTNSVETVEDNNFGFLGLNESTNTNKIVEKARNSMEQTIKKQKNSGYINTIFNSKEINPFPKAKDNNNNENMISRIKSSEFLANYSLASSNAEYNLIKIDTYSSIIIAIIRCLLNIQKFRNYFIKMNNNNKKDSDIPLSFEIKNLINQMCLRNEIHSEKMNEILKFFKLNDNYNYPISAMEKFLIFLEKESSPNNLNSNNSKKILSKDKEQAFYNFNNENKKENRSDLLKLFSGIEKRLHYCKDCKEKYYEFAYFNIFTICMNFNSLNPSINCSIKNSLTQKKLMISQKSGTKFVPFRNCLIDTLKFRKSLDGYKCLSCGGGRTLFSKNCYKESPEILIIKFEGLEANDNVDLVTYIDLAEFIEGRKDNESYSYKLNSFIEFNQNNGNFITYLNFKEYNEECQCYEDKWFSYSNDNNIMIDINDKDIINCPDLLIYEKNNNL